MNIKLYSCTRGGIVSVMSVILWNGLESKDIVRHIDDNSISRHAFYVDIGQELLFGQLIEEAHAYQARTPDLI